MAKLKIKKGDMVKVIAGDEKGREGKILSIDTKKLRVVIEGVNMISKHTKPNAKTPNGGIVKQEGSIHLSNLILIEPGTGKPTRVGRKIDEKKNNLSRYSKKSGELIK